MKIVIIDNYDSFTYNLSHLIKELGAEVDVVRNDQFQLEDLEQYNKIVLSASYGVLDSELQVYSNENVDADDNFTRSNALRVLHFPRMMEQIYMYDDRLYCLFESGAFAYRRYPGERMDRILIIDLDWIFK